jgi:steroid delta-isomerase-like uncharacterized protein
MTADQNKATVLRWFNEVCNGRKPEVAAEIFAANHQYHDPGAAATPAGPEGMKQLSATYYTGFADARWTVHETFAVDDVVVVRWTAGGTHTAPLNGLAPTGRRVSVTGIWMSRLRDGKMVETWDNWDTLGMLQQLGVVPQMA